MAWQMIRVAIEVVKCGCNALVTRANIKVELILYRIEISSCILLYPLHANVILG